MVPMAACTVALGQIGYGCEKPFLSVQTGPDETDEYADHSKQEGGSDEHHTLEANI